MSATTFAVESTLPRTATMSSARLRNAYFTEAKFECLRALRAPAFGIPFLLLPLVLYVLFGVLLAGSMSKGDLTVAKIMFVNWSIFGIMGPGMFGFGMFVATDDAVGPAHVETRAADAPGRVSAFKDGNGHSVLRYRHAHGGGCRSGSGASRIYSRTVFRSVAARNPGIGSVLCRGTFHRYARFPEERSGVRQFGISAVHASGRSVLSAAQVGAAARVPVSGVLSGQTRVAPGRSAQPGSAGNGSDRPLESRHAESLRGGLDRSDVALHRAVDPAARARGLAPTVAPASCRLSKGRPARAVWRRTPPRQPPGRRRYSRAAAFSCGKIKG